jgi:ligand-binding sensor domain-containing protein
VASDPSGRVWLGGKRIGAWAWDGEGWTQYTSADGLAGDTVWAIAFDGVNRGWFGTNNGLSVFDGETWTTYTVEDGLVHNDVRALAIADDGVWIGTWGGLSHLVFDSGAE